VYFCTYMHFCGFFSPKLGFFPGFSVHIIKYRRKDQRNCEAERGTRSALFCMLLKRRMRQRTGTHARLKTTVLRHTKLGFNSIYLELSHFAQHTQLLYKICSCTLQFPIPHCKATKCNNLQFIHMKFITVDINSSNNAWEQKINVSLNVTR
jgi:hypothetical protein